MDPPHRGSGSRPCVLVRDNRYAPAQIAKRTWDRVRAERNGAFLRPGARCALALGAITVALLGLAGAAHAQNVDTEPTLGIRLTSTQPTHYVDAGGHTVIVGEVVNLQDFPVAGVRVQAGLYADGAGEPLELIVGGTLLEVIPARASSPYVVRSGSPGLDVAGVSVNLLGFTSSAAKPRGFDLGDLRVLASDTLVVEGTMSGAGLGASDDVELHALVYDSFVPPRLLGVHSARPLDALGAGPAGDADAMFAASSADGGASVRYEFSLAYGEEAAMVRVIAESGSHSSNAAEARVMRTPSSPLMIQNVSLVSASGSPVTMPREGAESYIRSTIDGGGAEGSEYEYIAQVVRFGHLPVIEFVGSFEGEITPAGLAQPLVGWTPRSSGLFYIETYLWSADGVPIAAQGPVTLLNVEPRQ